MKQEKSKITITFNNPEASRVIRTLAIIQTGMTMKGFMHKLLAQWLMSECGKKLEEVQAILGYEF